MQGNVDTRRQTQQNAQPSQQHKIILSNIKRHICEGTAKCGVHGIWDGFLRIVYLKMVWTRRMRYAISHRIRILTVAQLFLLNWLPRQPDSWRIWVQQCSYLWLIKALHASQEFDILVNDDIRKFSLWLIFYDRETWRMHQPAKKKPLFRKHKIWPNSKWYGKLPRRK